MNDSGISHHMAWMIGATLVTLILMEPYSAWIHRVLWHGPLWFIHRTHHRERMDGAAPPAPLVANDILSASHAPVAFVCFVFGVLSSGPAAAAVLGVGMGMTLYGVLYVAFHDGMVHGRLPLAGLLRVRLFEEMKEAHARHHRTNAAPYGFFASAWWCRRGSRSSPT